MEYEFLLIASGIPDHRSLSHPPVLSEFFPAWLTLTRSNCQSLSVGIRNCWRRTRTAEFRMMPVNQPEMVRRTSAELERNEQSSPLLSATFHRSLDGTGCLTMVNGRARKRLKQFSSNLVSTQSNHWEGLARNEFHLYNVAHTCQHNRVEGI